MRISRLLACTTVVGLAGLTPIVTATPSQAADTYASTVVATPSQTQVVPAWDAEAGEFANDEIDVAFDLDSERGSAPTGGTTTLLAQKAGSTEWVSVAESTASTSSFTGVRPSVQTTYKAVYSGYKAPNGDVYGRAESATFTVSVARRITYPVAGFVVKGRVTPRYRGKKVVVTVSREQNTGYTAFTTTRTNARGRYKVTLPRRGGAWYWNFRIKGDARYLANGFVWKTFIG